MNHAGLRRWGYRTEDVTGPGFRSTATTLLNGMERDSVLIKKQLAQQERDGVRGTSNCVAWLPDRRKVMEAWAVTLSTRRDGVKVCALHAAA